MGYMGLASWVDSDLASDLMEEISHSVISHLKLGLQEEGGNWNTCGIINVGLYLETLKEVNYSMVEFLRETYIPALEKLISICKEHDWEGDDARKAEHVNALERIYQHCGTLV